MPSFVITEKCDGCQGQDKTACMYICPHDLMVLDKDKMKAVNQEPVQCWECYKTEEGRWCYPAKPDVLKYLDFPNPRKWSVEEEDWELPENWEQIIFHGMRDRLKRFRSFKVFMDVCVRCGACAYKCHFFLGTGDPKNMPVLRAELLRSVYRGEFTLAGKLLREMVGARKLMPQVL